MNCRYLHIKMMDLKLNLKAFSHCISFPLLSLLVLSFSLGYFSLIEIYIHTPQFVLCTTQTNDGLFPFPTTWVLGTRELTPTTGCAWPSWGSSIFIMSPLQTVLAALSTCRDMFLSPTKDCFLKIFLTFYIRLMA